MRHIGFWFVALVLCGLAPPSHAGRGLPEPLLQQFAEGYGVVAAEVIEAEADPFDPFEFGVKCRAVTVCAETVRIHPRLGIKAGDTFFVTLGVGYGAAVEMVRTVDGEDGKPRPATGDDGPFPRGARF